jgi:hypothetical protein
MTRQVVSYRSRTILDRDIRSGRVSLYFRRSSLWNGHSSLKRPVLKNGSVNNRTPPKSWLRLRHLPPFPQITSLVEFLALH